MQVLLEHGSGCYPILFLERVSALIGGQAREIVMVILDLKEPRKASCVGGPGL